jgi:hypothetical protein
VEVRGYANAASWVYGHGIRPGDWQDGDLISLAEVPVLIRDWLDDAQALRGQDEGDIAESLAALHARFEQVHPFLDGNGRTGRLLLVPRAWFRCRRWRLRNSLRTPFVWLPCVVD